MDHCMVQFKAGGWWLARGAWRLPIFQLGHCRIFRFGLILWGGGLVVWVLVGGMGKIVVGFAARPCGEGR